MAPSNERKPDYACRKCVDEWVRKQEEEYSLGYAEYVKKLGYGDAKKAMWVSGLRSICKQHHEKRDSHLCAWSDLPLKLKKHIDKRGNDDDPDEPKANRKGAAGKEAKAVAEAVAAEKKKTEKAEKAFQKLKAKC